MARFNNNSQTKHSRHDDDKTDKKKQKNKNGGEAGGTDEYRSGRGQAAFDGEQSRYCCSCVVLVDR